MPLNVKDGMGAWIKDFQKSDAPQFKGKSDKERREMAMAAYLDAKKGQKDEGYVSMAQQRAVWATRKDGGKGHPDNKKKSKKESMDKPPFTPDPPKPAAKNSDDTKTSPMSRAKQLAKMARDRGLKKEDVELEEGFIGRFTKGFVDGMQSELKKQIHPQHHSKYDIKSVRTFGDAMKIAKKAKDAGHVVKESVELDEAHAYSKAADALRDYANKHGGMDKKDFHTAAKHIENIGRANIMQKGHHLGMLSKHLRDLDTSPREKVLSVLHKHGHKVGDFMPGAKMRRESVDEAGTPERLAMIRKAGEKINKEKKKAERDAKKAMSKDKDMMGEAKLDELSPATHQSYQAKAFRSGAAAMAAKRMGTMSTKDAYEKEKKRHTGIEVSKSLQRRDARRKRNEEVEENVSAPQTAAHRRAMMVGVNRTKKKEKPVSELKKSTLGSYINKAAKDAASKAYGAASAAKDNRADQAGKDFSKSMKRLRGIDTATKKLANKPSPKSSAMDDMISKAKKLGRRLTDDELNQIRKKHNKESVEEAKSFDQKFRDHLKFATSKSPAVQAYMKKRKADRDAAHAKQDPAAVKKNYGPAVIPPGTAYNKASKKGMNPSQAANAVSTAFKNRAKGGKLPK